MINTNTILAIIVILILIGIIFCFNYLNLSQEPENFKLTNNDLGKFHFAIETWKNKICRECPNCKVIPIEIITNAKKIGIPIFNSNFTVDTKFGNELNDYYINRIIDTFNEIGIRKFTIVSDFEDKIIVYGMK